MANNSGVAFSLLFSIYMHVDTIFLGFGAKFLNCDISVHEDCFDASK